MEMKSLVEPPLSPHVDLLYMLGIPCLSSSLGFCWKIYTGSLAVARSSWFSIWRLWLMVWCCGWLGEGLLVCEGLEEVLFGGLGSLGEGLEGGG